MLSNFAWHPFGEGINIGGNWISGIHTTPIDSAGWAPAFAYDTALPIENGQPEPLVNGQVISGFPTQGILSEQGAFNFSAMETGGFQQHI